MPFQIPQAALDLLAEPDLETSFISIGTDSNWILMANHIYFSLLNKNNFMFEMIGSGSGCGQE